MAQSQTLQNSKVDLLSTQLINFNGRQIKNASDGIDQQDYVTLSQVNSLIKTAVPATTNNTTTININGIIKNGKPGAILFVDSGGRLAQDSVNLNYNFGTKTLDAINFNLSSLTVSKPVKSDANKNLVSGLIVLTTDVSGILPVANGGTGAAALTLDSVVVGNGTSAVQLIAGISGSLVIGTTTASPGSGSATFLTGFTLGTVSLQYKDWTGTNQSLTVVVSGAPSSSSALTSVTGTFLTAATITVNNFTKGVRST